MYIISLADIQGSKNTLQFIYCPIVRHVCVLTYSFNFHITEKLALFLYLFLQTTLEKHLPF